MKDQKEVVTLLSAETLEEEISLLQTLYENYKKEETILKIKVDKKKYKK